MEPVGDALCLQPGTNRRKYRWIITNAAVIFSPWFSGICWAVYGEKFTGRVIYRRSILFMPFAFVSGVFARYGITI